MIKYLLTCLWSLSFLQGHCLDYGIVLVAPFSRQGNQAQVLTIFSSAENDEKFWQLQSPTRKFELRTPMKSSPRLSPGDYRRNATHPHLLHFGASNFLHWSIHKRITVWGKKLRISLERILKTNCTRGIYCLGKLLIANCHFITVNRRFSALFTCFVDRGRQRRRKRIAKRYVCFCLSPPPLEKKTMRIVCLLFFFTTPRDP